VILGRDRVEGLRVEQTRISEEGQVEGTGVQHTIEAQMVVRAVGYAGVVILACRSTRTAGSCPTPAAGRSTPAGVPRADTSLAG
jgi:ferredoxin/flavodoxin---NADP+ reductase